ncbi:MAG: hypothetical protein WD045_04090 [Pirellulaceae bacterium]
MPFPFNYPWPSTFYLVLYVATFVLHHVAMHYVVAGCLVVALRALLPRSIALGSGTERVIDHIRGWLPFSLGAAITAGVAPLLFVQILYPNHFYTANLLLSWRWMIVVPVLIVSFYLLYLLKSDMYLRFSPWLRATIALGTAGMFLFVGFCWTANHLLSNQPAAWPEVYLTGDLPLAPLVVIARTLIWLGAALVTLATIVVWQLRWSITGKEEGENPVNLILPQMLALAGLVILALATAGYLVAVPAAERALLGTGSGLLYVAVIVVCCLGMAGLWWVMTKGLVPPLVSLSAVTGAMALAWLALGMLREQVRVAAIDFEALLPQHAEMAKIQGLWLFLLLAVINGGLIAWCFMLVRKGLKTGTTSANLPAADQSPPAPPAEA